VFKAHRLLYHSTLGFRVIKKKKGLTDAVGAGAEAVVGHDGALLREALDVLRFLPAQWAYQSIIFRGKHISPIFFEVIIKNYSAIIIIGTKICY